MDRQIINKIVKATGIKEQEVVLLQFWGEVEQLSILTEFSKAVAAVGASPVELIQSRSRNQIIFQTAKEGCYGEAYDSMFQNVDVVLDIFTYQPVVLGCQLEDQQMNLYKGYMRNLFQTLMKVPKFIQIRIPTIENAKESGLEVNDYLKRMSDAYDIDYDNLKKRCESKIQELNPQREKTLITGNNEKLYISYEGRKWYADTGDGDLPCGEVYIAPIEHKTEGEVYFDQLYVEDLGVFHEVVLHIKKGIIVNTNNKKLNLFFHELWDCDKTICELGFGMNDHVRDACGYPLLDEKMDGTFHIAIGNNTLFGGRNQSAIHMDFVGKEV